MITAERLAEVFVEVADTLVDEFDLIEFLHMVTKHTSHLFDARAAGLLLADHRGHLKLMAASDERSESLELFQVQTREGPCQDCYTTGIAVVNADLSEATARWPQFAPVAVAAGYRSVHAFPLRLRGNTYGALNLSAATPAKWLTPKPVSYRPLRTSRPSGCCSSARSSAGTTSPSSCRAHSTHE